MTTQSKSKSCFSNLLKNIAKCIIFAILAIVLAIITIPLMLYFNDNLYFLKHIEQISGDNSLIFFSLMFLAFVLYSIIPMNLEPIIAITSFYFSKKFGFSSGLVLSTLNTFLAVNLGSIATILFVRFFIYPYFKKSPEMTFNIWSDLTNEYGIILVILLKLTFFPNFISNCLIGFSNISITEFIIGSLAPLPRYLSISAFASNINSIKYYGFILLSLKSHPYHEVLFTTISFLSHLFLLGLFYRSYIKIKDRVPVPTEENITNLPNNTSTLNSEIV
ncbi:uncharacterized protein cubi_02604 [Cryptosporidium ubiquitum]|uniref:SNARE associated Golgi protein n=1 Tax=Cryptosporidium ubiquitum TaxID=857276 RepID=A0A1J4MGR0_9CRYT|nr:uncharacterized protein cubi_02604 [Cryptosporidium ubiquitum]OII73392.1 hypothetical protein cubi_02604 [Cryptosporidium ubiquitum]